MKSDLFLAKPFSTKRFEEKRFVNISVCQSNIKSKKGTYYGRVCKLGRLNAGNLLAILKERNPHLDISLVASAFEQMANIILDMVGQGYNVDFFNLGTFFLGTSGKIEVSEKAMKKCEEDANYDISDKVDKNVNFAFKFSPSQAVKKSLKNVKMNLAIKKHKAPKIDRIEDISPPTSKASPSILKVIGDGLKVLGEKSEVGVYIEEKEMDNRCDTKYIRRDNQNSNEENAKRMKENRMKARRIKLTKEAIIQNENKTLMIVLDEHLKEGCEYYIKIATQGLSGGKLGKEVRMSKKGFCLREKLT